MAKAKKMAKANISAEELQKTVRYLALLFVTAYMT
jgi:hypothetical protein